MRAGKDFMVDKPGLTTFDQLAAVKAVQKETKRIFSVDFTERFEVRATTRAGALVKAGAIGKVVHTCGLGPHRLNRHLRPEWFFRREAYGGILVDIASHQFDQFLFFTGSSDARIVAARAANVAHPQDPGFDDLGEVMIESEKASGYFRVDWFTPDGLSTWGDGRFTIVGTEGTIELRKYVDVAGRPGIDHLFLVDKKGMHYVDCSDETLPYYTDLRRDIFERTETAMPQAHCFKVCELALTAQALAMKSAKHS
jgi:predicted dehydrogenase